MTSMTYESTPFWGLPDPDTHGEFYADVPMKRLMAWIIDTVLIIGLSVLVVPLTAFTGLFFFAGILMTVGLAYRIITLTRSSATPGMRLMAIEFRDARGDKFGLMLASLHTLLSFAMTCVFVARIVSALMILTTARAQGLQDMLLGTAAINRPRNY